MIWSSLAPRIAPALAALDPQLAQAVESQLADLVRPWIEGAIDASEFCRRLGMARNDPQRDATYAAHVRRQTAVHEAGHVVVAAALGFRVTCATIEPDAADLAHGSMTYSARGSSHIEHATVTLGGPWAEKQGGFDVDDSLAHHREQASREVLQAEPGLGIAERVALLNFCEVRARELISRHWAAIERVADALHAHGTLDEATVRALVTPPSPATDAASLPVPPSAPDTPSEPNLDNAGVPDAH